MRWAGFREKVRSGARLAGTFVKTPNLAVVEVLAQSELDFICLDGEHAPFDRTALEGCLAVARALDFPVLIRVGDRSSDFSREDGLRATLDWGHHADITIVCDKARKVHAHQVTNYKKFFSNARKLHT